jgi:hypothetical protein
MPGDLPVGIRRLVECDGLDRHGGRWQDAAGDKLLFHGNCRSLHGGQVQEATRAGRALGESFAADGFEQA